MARLIRSLRCRSNLAHARPRQLRLTIVRLQRRLVGRIAKPAITGKRCQMAIEAPIGAAAADGHATGIEVNELRPLPAVDNGRQRERETGLEPATSSLGS